MEWSTWEGGGSTWEGGLAKALRGVRELRRRVSEYGVVIELGNGGSHCEVDRVPDKLGQILFPHWRWRSREENSTALRQPRPSKAY